MKLSISTDVGKPVKNRDARRHLPPKPRGRPAGPKGGQAHSPQSRLKGRWGLWAESCQGAAVNPEIREVGNSVTGCKI